jgi:hypothetical protein
MNEQTRIEWKEMREFNDEHVLFHMIAIKTPHGWWFSEQESWETQSHEVAPIPENVVIAEYAKEALARGCMTFDSVFCLVRVEDCGVSTHEMSREHWPPTASLRAKNRTVLTRLMFPRGRYPASISGDETPPQLAA